MSSTAISTRASSASSASFLARRPVWQVSYLSGLAASVIVEVWGLAARAAGVPMRAAGPFRQEPQAHLPSYGVAAARPLARRPSHRGGHGDLDQAHARRRTPDRRCDHHSDSREAAIATT